MVFQRHFQIILAADISPFPDFFLSFHLPQADLMVEHFTLLKEDLLTDLLRRTLLVKRRSGLFKYGLFYLRGSLILVPQSNTLVAILALSKMLLSVYTGLRSRSGRQSVTLLRRKLTFLITSSRMLSFIRKCLISDV